MNKQETKDIRSENNEKTFQMQRSAIDELPEYAQIVLQRGSIDKLLMVLREEQFLSFDEVIEKLITYYWDVKQHEVDYHDPLGNLIEMMKQSQADPNNLAWKGSVQTLSLAYPELAEKAQNALQDD